MTPNFRIGVFYDGNFLLHASNYYNYIHTEKRRLSLSGLHRFVRHRVSEEMDLDLINCQITEAHYFRGRLNASEASMRGNQLYNDRVFDDILMSEGVHTHYLPLRKMQGRKEERGVDVWLSLEAYERVLNGALDMVVLIVSDTDYTPLMRKINAAGIPVMLLSWEFEYINDDGVRMVTKTSHELLSLATYPIAMQEEIDEGLDREDPFICDLFVNNENYSSSTSQSNGTETSEILSLKSGFGFIKYPNNNLFFHAQDLDEGDFSELEVGDLVEFTIEKNQMKQDVAKHVRKITPDDNHYAEVDSEEEE